MIFQFCDFSILSFVSFCNQLYPFRLVLVFCWIEVLLLRLKAIDIPNCTGFRASSRRLVAIIEKTLLRLAPSKIAVTVSFTGAPRTRRGFTHEFTCRSVQPCGCRLSFRWTSSVENHRRRSVAVFHCSLRSAKSLSGCTHFETASLTSGRESRHSLSR